MASTNQGGLFRALHDVRALKPTYTCTASDYASVYIITQYIAASD